MKVDPFAVFAFMGMFIWDHIVQEKSERWYLYRKIKAWNTQILKDLVYILNIHAYYTLFQYRDPCDVRSGVLDACHVCWHIKEGTEGVYLELSVELLFKEQKAATQLLSVNDMKAHSDEICVVWFRGPNNAQRVFTSGSARACS